VGFRRGLLAALVLYVTLDMAVPVIGGAFVFEVSDSVESIRAARARAAAEPVATPRPPDREVPRPERAGNLGAPAMPGDDPPVVARVVPYRPRGALAPARPADDH
jgi:hypothetical protein